MNQPAKPMTILQVCNRLGYGGMESYLINLCRGLAARGHRLLAAGESGELVPSIKAVGVKFVPTRIRGKNVFEAGKELAAIIQQEKIEIIHAHNWTAGAAAYRGAINAGIPFLLSVHGVRPAWQRFLVNYWSPKVMVVSPRLRKNLINDFRISPERVIETFIGINTRIYSPGLSSVSLKDELAIPSGSLVILHVSRFSKTKGHVALALIEAAPALDTAIPNLVILIAGLGELEPQIRKAAHQANEQIGHNTVRMLGPRQDIPDLMRLASVVVGTATVAMEAMATGCAVTAAGKFGFVGTITPELFTSSYEACFGDHSAPNKLSAQLLHNSLVSLLNDNDYRKVLGTWGTKLIKERYNNELMAEDVEKVYSEMIGR
jgi:glycosyltransferase involved in cell wall biosynthesis